MCFVISCNYTYQDFLRIFEFPNQSYVLILTISYALGKIINLDWL